MIDFGSAIQQSKSQTADTVLAESRDHKGTTGAVNTSVTFHILPITSEQLYFN